MATIEYERLAMFAAVAANGGFSAAAEQLRRPKSSISRAVAALEAELGVRLLHRTTRRVGLSTAGAALYERIASPLEALDRATVELPERDAEPSGLLRVTTLEDLGTSIVSELATRFVTRYPRVDLDLVLTDRLVDLIAERVDVALRVSMRHLRDSSLSARRVARVHMQLYAAPSYLERRGRPKHPHDLAKHDWVTIRTSRPLQLEGPGGVVALPTRAHITCDGGGSVRAAIVAGGGVGLLPSYLVGEDVARGTIVPILSRWSVRGGTLWFICPSTRQIPPKVSAFRELVIESFAGRAHVGA